MIGLSHQPKILMTQMFGIGGSSSIQADGSPGISVSTAGGTTTIGNSLPGNCFVFRPGGGSASKNVYTSFPLLYADLIQVQGEKTILCDNTYQTPTIPARGGGLKWDLTDTFLDAVHGTAIPGNTSLNGVAVNIADGCQFSAIKGYGYAINLICTGVNSDVLTQADGTQIILDSFSGFTNTGTGRFLIQNSDLVSPIIYLGAGVNLVTNGSTAGILLNATGAAGNNILYMGKVCLVGNGTNPTIELTSNVAFLLVIEAGCTIQTNAIIGPSDSIILAIFLGGGLGLSGGPSLSPQPNFLGSIVPIAENDAAYINYTSTSGLISTLVSTALDEINTKVEANEADAEPRYSAALAANNVNAAETDLGTKAMAAGDLANPSDGYLIRGGGFFANTVSAKRIRVYFGATVIADTGSVVLTNGRWWIEARVFRIASASQIAISDGNTTLGALVNFSSKTTPTETLSGAITIKFTGLGTASNDVGQDFMDIIPIEGVT